MARVFMNFLLCLLCTALLGGCGGGDDDAAGNLSAEQAAAPHANQPAADGAAPDFAAFPPPAQLTRQASAPGDPLRYEDDYDNTLPFQRASAEFEDNAEFVRYDPAFDTADPAAEFGGLAFAMYELRDLDNYVGTPQLRFDWRNAPADFDDFWVAVSDFENNRWVWRQGPVGTAALAVPEAPNYLSMDGDMLVMVLLTGTTQAELSWLLYGDNYFQAYFSANPTQGTGSLDVDFDASDSFIAGSATMQLDFDYEGDGTYELIDTGPLFIHFYGSPDTYHPTLRLTDDNNDTATYTRQVLVINPNNDPPTATLQANKLSGDAPLFVVLDASGSSDPDGEIIKYEWEFDNTTVFDRETESAFTGWSFGKVGANKVTVRVTDNDLATAEAELTITLDTGWHYATIDSDITYDPQVSIASVGLILSSRMSAAYYVNDTEELRFARAVDQKCTDWEDVVVVDTSTQSGMFPSLRDVDDRPAIAYSGDNGSGGRTLNYIRATSGSGAAWDDPVVIEDGISARPAMAFAGSVPAILNAEVGITEGLQWYVATNDVGDAWIDPVDVTTAGSGNELLGQALFSVGGQPAACYSTKVVFENIYTLHYVRANDGDGNSWGDPLDLTGQLEMSALAAQAPDPVLAVVDGNPAIAWCGAGVDTDVFFLRAEQPEGTSWGTPTLVADAGQPTGAIDLIVFGGNPALCWYDRGQGDERLMYVRADDAQGTSWGPSMVVSPAGNYGSDFDMSSSGYPVVVFSYGSNPAATILRSATLY